MTNAVKHVVVLVIDRLQAGILGAYGNAWIHTPQVDRLAARGFVFDQAFACEPTLADVLDQLWEPLKLLSEFGVRTTLLTDDAAAYEHPLAASFAENLLLDLPPTVKHAAEEFEEAQLAQFTSAATERIAASTEPSVLWLHTRGLAGPWDAPLDLRNQYAEDDDPTPPNFTRPPNRRLPADFDPDELLGITHAYAGQVSLFDACLGVLLESLDQSPLAASTMFVLVGARGFPLGEHGRVGECDAALYQELTHVPLIVRLPDGAALARSSLLATHGDVAELIAGWLDGPASATLSLIRGEQPAWRDHLRMTSTNDRGIRTCAWYFHEARGEDGAVPELFVKPDDRWDMNDIANRCPEVASQLSELLAMPADSDASLPESLTQSHD